MNREHQPDWIEMERSEKPSVIPYKLRPYAAAQDEALVYKAYLMSFFRMGYRMKTVHGHAGSQIPSSIYYAAQRVVLNNILEHAQVSIACGVGDEWQAFGFIIYDDLPSGFVLHYINVKRLFRRAGLGGHMLLQQIGKRKTVINTHFTAPWRGLSRVLSRANIEVIYDPYLAK